MPITVFLIISCVSLLNYFKRETPRNSLPDLHGPLSSIEEVNKEVDICYKATSTEKKRSPYNFATPEQKAKIGKYAAETSRSIGLKHVCTRRHACLLSAQSSSARQIKQINYYIIKRSSVLKG